MDKKIFNILFVLYPVTNIYGIGIQGLSVGKILLLLCGLYSITKNHLSFSFPKRYLLFAIWMFIVPYFYILSSWTDIHSIIYKSIGLLTFVILIGLSCRLVTFEYAFRYFKKSTLIFTSFFCIQFIVKQATGITLSGLIPGLPLADATSIDSYLSMQSTLTRCCSVFLEPAHFAVYITLYLALKLILLNGKVWDKDVLYILFALIILQSGNGYLCLLALGIAYIIINLKSILKNSGRLVMLILSIACMSCLLYLLVKNSAMLSDTFSRIAEIEADGNQNSSGFIRIFRGFYYYSDLSPIEKCLGIGQGNEISYAQTHSMYNYLMLDTYTDTVYLNGVQQILVYGGLIGLLLFLNFMLKYYKCRATLFLVLPFTVLIFISGMYNSSTMLMYLVFMDMVRRKYTKDNLALYKTQINYAHK